MGLYGRQLKLDLLISPIEVLMILLPRFLEPLRRSLNYEHSYLALYPAHLVLLDSTTIVQEPQHLHRGLGH